MQVTDAVLAIGLITMRCREDKEHELTVQRSFLIKRTQNFRYYARGRKSLKEALCLKMMERNTDVSNVIFF